MLRSKHSRRQRRWQRSSPQDKGNHVVASRVARIGVYSDFVRLRRRLGTDAVTAAACTGGRGCRAAGAGSAACTAGRYAGCDRPNSTARTIGRRAPSNHHGVRRAQASAETASCRRQRNSSGSGAWSSAADALRDRRSQRRGRPRGGAEHGEPDDDFRRGSQRSSVHASRRDSSRRRPA